MAWIKVELIPVTIIGWHEYDSWGWLCSEPVYSSRQWRISCKVCGHDDYRPNYDDAVWRSESMHQDHIPFSPDGSLTCKNW